MSDTGLLVRAVLVVGLLTLLVTTMAESPPPGSEFDIGLSPWNDLSNSLRGGPRFPTFIDPRPKDFIAYELSPTQLGVDASSTVATFGCGTTYYKCVERNDGDSSYVTLSSLNPTFSTGNYANPPGLVAQLIVVHVTARAIGGDASFTARIENSLGTALQPKFGTGDVTESTTYSTTSISARNDGSWDFSVGGGDGRILTRITRVSGTMRVTSVQVDVHTLRPACTGDFFGNTGCQINRFFESVVSGFQFLINGAGFVLTSIVALGEFVFSILFAVVLGLALSLLWLLNLDMPSLVFGMLAVVFVAMLAAIFIVAVRVVRGVGS